jgi:membrane protein
MPDAPATTSAPPGHGASAPTGIPRAGWKQILVRTKDEIKADRVGLMAGGVAFYAMLAIFPALMAAITLWGLVSDPVQIQQSVDEFAAALPQNAAELVSEQVARIAASSTSALGWTLVLSLLGALWSASSGTKGLMNAVNAAYDEEETRGFLEVRGLALGLTIGAIFFALTAVGLIAVVPAVLGSLGLGGTGASLVQWLRWPVLALALIAGLAVIYRYAPDRDQPQWQWASWGSVVATAIWLLASAGFALYVNNFGSYGETYGSLAGVIVLMLWFFLTAFAVLVGAELNAEMERQTLRDTTQGPPEPMGQRGAYVADHPPQE